MQPRGPNPRSSLVDADAQRSPNPFTRIDSRMAIPLRALQEKRRDSLFGQDEDFGSLRRLGSAASITTDVGEITAPSSPLHATFSSQDLRSPPSKPAAPPSHLGLGLPRSESQVPLKAPGTPPPLDLLSRSPSGRSPHTHPYNGNGNGGGCLSNFSRTQIIIASTITNVGGGTTNNYISNANLGDFTVSHTELHSPRTDIPMQLSSNTSVLVKSGAGQNIALQASGSGVVSVDSITIKDSTLSSTDSVAGLNLRSQGAMIRITTNNPAAPLQVDQGMNVNGVITALGLLANNGITASSLSVSGGVSASHLSVSGALSGSMLTVSGPVQSASLQTGTITTGGVTSNGVITATAITSSGSISSGSSIIAQGVITSVAGFYSNGGLTGASLSVSGSVTGASASVSGAVTVGTLYATGAISGASLSTTGNISGASGVFTGILSSSAVSTSGAVTSGSLTTSGGMSSAYLTSTGTISASRFVGGSASLTGALTSSSMSTGGSITASSLFASGASFSGYVTASGITSAGAITSASVTTTVLSATSIDVGTGVIGALTSTSLSAVSIRTGALTGQSGSFTGALTSNSITVVSLSAANGQTGALTTSSLSNSNALTTSTLQVSSFGNIAGTLTASTIMVTSSLTATGGVSTTLLTATNVIASSLTLGAGGLSTSGSVTSASLSTSGSVTVGGSASVTGSVSSTGAMTASRFDGIGVVPVGTIVSHYIDLTGADALAKVRQLGYALCDGTTAVSQGITGAVITSVLPNLNNGYFLRGGAPGSSGVFQDHAMQGHIHTTSTNGAHTHTMSAAGSHSHAEVGFVITNCDYCGGCNFKTNDCTGRATTPATSTVADHTHTIASAGDHTHTISSPVTDGVNGTPNTANETRPSNMAVVWLMRVK